MAAERVAGAATALGAQLTIWCSSEASAGQHVLLADNRLPFVEHGRMKRTVELEVDVADDVAYGNVIADIVGAVEKHGGDVRDLRYTRTTAAVTAQLNAVRPEYNWKQFSGSIHAR